LLRSYRKSRFATVPEILFAYRVRSRIAWGKTFRTRKTILGIQLRKIFGMGQWHYGALATMVFVARVAMDLSNLLIQKLWGTDFLGFRIAAVGVTERSQWSAVLEAIMLQEDKKS
jgi:hypothetical protein